MTDQELQENREFVRSVASELADKLRIRESDESDLTPEATEDF